MKFFKSVGVSFIQFSVGMSTIDNAQAEMSTVLTIRELNIL